MVRTGQQTSPVSPIEMLDPFIVGVCTCRTSFLVKKRPLLMTFLFVVNLLTLRKSKKATDKAACITSRSWVESDFYECKDLDRSSMYCYKQSYRATELHVQSVYSRIFQYGASKLMHAIKM